MKRIGVVVYTAWMAGLAASGWAEEKTLMPPLLSAFDEEVAICRRMVRAYCAIAQTLGAMPEMDKEQATEGLRLLAEARKRWAELELKYAANPPSEYAKDKMFPARLRDFAHALEDMEKALAAGDARRSFLACGFGCGLFVQMHEQNGLNYAIDKLFHLRADIRTAQAVLKTQGLPGVRARMANLLQKRDAVLLAPPPFPQEDPRAAAYTAAVEELSSAMDRLALAVAAGDARQVEAILVNGLLLVNKPYGIAL